MMGFLLFNITFVVLVVSIQNSSGNKINSHTKNSGSSLSVLNVTIICPQKDTLLIKGTDVKVSDFVKSNGDVNNPCINETSIKFLNVFALRSLVIDVNVNVTGSHLMLFFIAPSWVIEGKRRIVVDGYRGEYIPKAKDGNSKDMDGLDGKPGLPGGPGGIFFGIGETFVFGKNLEITANGGIGGPGQVGGDGFNQVRGRYVDEKALGKIWCGLYYDICRSKEKKYQLNLRDNQGNYSDFTCEGRFERKNMERCSYKLFGWEGEEGGRGGNGGRGGKGGFPGKVQLVELKEPSGISIYSAFGSNGEDGKGGFGGESGNNGYNIIYEDVNFLAPPKIYAELHDQRFAPSGSDGCVTVGYKDTPKADVLEGSRVLGVVNQFKSWLRHSSDNNFNRHTVTFYKNLEENSYIRKLYSMKDFLSEIKSINLDSTLPNITVDFLPIYESLLDRILYHINLFNDTQNKENKIILKLLYTDILGRIYNTKQRSETYLAIDIPAYFQKVKKTLLNVKDLIIKKTQFDPILNKINELNEYKENYGNQFNNTIQKFRNNTNITYKEIVPNENLEKMDKLISDIIIFKNRPISYEQELLSWGKKLHNCLLSRANMYIVQLISNTWIILTDFAELIGSLVDIGAKVPKALLLGDEYKPKIKYAQATIPIIKSKIEKIKSDEITRNNMFLKNILKTTNENLDILSDVMEEVQVVHEKLQGVNSLSTLTALRSDLLEIVEIRRNELSIFDVNPSTASNPKQYLHIVTARSAFNKLSRVVKTASLGRGFVDIYNTFEHNSTKLDVVIEYSDKAIGLLKAAKEHEDLQCVIVYQLVQRIDDMISGITENPGSVSNIASEVVKWNIPHILANIKSKAQEFIKTFPSKETLIDVLKYLEGESVKLIDIFERLKNYLHQRQLENHINDTSNAIKRGIKFSDALLSTQYQEIKTSLGSNMILQHYKKAVDTFMQFVFPIAHIYFTDIVLPHHFDVNDDMSKTVSIAITQIDKMMKKVEDYKRSVLNGDGIVERKTFGGWQNSSGKPFFVWKNEFHKDMIVNLLSGKEVILNPDIKTSGIKENAIKFNNLHFLFKARSAIMQSKFDDLFMGNFDVHDDHLGNSQYCYDDKIYLITSQTLEIFYTPVKTADGEPMPGFGGAYEYILEANIMLSPYASWKVYLTEEADYSFDDLLEFKDYIDIEMVGNAYFINVKKVKTLDLRVDKYYDPLS